jgi:RNA recognition motif-containing protein
MNLYVGNLSFETTQKDLQNKFKAFGAVKSATMVTDGTTGRSKVRRNAGYG